MPRIIPRPWVVLLAAGGSRRFGRPKLLAEVAGESLLHRAARAALGAAPNCIVVLGAHAGRLARELYGLPVRIIVNRHWRRGLSSSLRVGVGALPRSVRGALILLADQVAIGPAELELLIAAWRRAPGRIVAARAAGVIGPPAILPRRLFKELRRLRGDRGARDLLRDGSQAALEFELPASALDVDRPDDLARFSRRRAERQLK